MQRLHTQILFCTASREGRPVVLARRIGIHNELLRAGILSE